MIVKDRWDVVGRTKNAADKERTGAHPFPQIPHSSGPGQINFHSYFIFIFGTDYSRKKRIEKFRSSNPRSSHIILECQKRYRIWTRRNNLRQAEYSILYAHMRYRAQHPRANAASLSF